MLYTEVVQIQTHSKGRAPLDDFECFAVEALGAVLTDIEEDWQPQRGDYCWLSGAGSETLGQRETEDLVYGLFPQAAATPEVPLHQHPTRYLKHLLTIPQLPAPPRVLLLPAVAASSQAELPACQQPEVATFGIWLETELGQEVYRRIMNNLHAVPLEFSAAYFDTAEDVQQKALIWLWQHWETDPGYQKLTRSTTSLSHAAGCITKIAILRARCMYAKRKREGREQQTDLYFDDGEEKLIPVLVSADVIPSTDVCEHDRLSVGCDKRGDVAQSIENVVERMRAATLRVRMGGNSKGKLDKRYANTPIEHITRTIVEGYMYHYTDRYNQTGTFRQFCHARGVSRGQMARWRPQIFDYLREELSAYAPT